MKKFMMVAAAVAGISWMGLGAIAEAGGPKYYGSNHNHGHHNHGHNHGHSNGWGYGGYRPVYRAPVYGVPVYNSYPYAAPTYPYYGGYGGYQGTSFGISTPGFGLYIR